MRSKKSSNKGSNEDKRKELLRKTLLKEREETIKEITDQLGRQLLDEDLQAKIDSALDVGDQSLLNLTEGIDISLLEMRNRMRKDIDDALNRLEEGTYGICIDCGEEISEGRLKVVPFAIHCVKCQERNELLEKIEKEEERG